MKNIVEFIDQSLQALWLTEVRSAFGFAPRRSWIQKAKSTGKELKTAPTLESYYDLHESGQLVWDNEKITEKDILVAMKFYDEKIPSIRSLFKHEITDSLRAGKKEINRGIIKTILDAGSQQKSVIISLLLRHFYMDVSGKCFDDMF